MLSISFAARDALLAPFSRRGGAMATLSRTRCRACARACPRARARARSAPLAPPVRVHTRTPPSAAAADASALRAAAVEAAEAGASVVRATLGAAPPRSVAFREKSGAMDIVTATDEASERAVIGALRSRLGEGVAVLGEEGGVQGAVEGAELLWCVDPLDGTTNYAAAYPSFAVSVACLHRGVPLAAAVVEFTGGPHAWATRTFAAARGEGATCEGHDIHCSPNGDLSKSVLVTGFGYDHGAAWAANMEHFKHFTDVSRGVRRLGSAAVDLCHVALGLVDAYWEYNLSPWDTAAGVLIAAEAGARVTTMDGGQYSVFDRSMMVAAPGVQAALLEVTAETTRRLVEEEGVDLARWKIPEGMLLELP